MDLKAAFTYGPITITSTKVHCPKYPRSCLAHVAGTHPEFGWDRVFVPEASDYLHRSWSLESNGLYEVRYGFTGCLFVRAGQVAEVSVREAKQIVRAAGPILNPLPRKDRWLHLHKWCSEVEVHAVLTPEEIQRDIEAYCWI